MPEAVDSDILLNEQMQLFERQAHQLSPNLTDSERLNTVIALGLAVFRQISQQESRVGNDSRRKSLDVDAARHVAELYARWFGPAKAVLRALNQSIAEGDAIAGSSESTDACRHARVPALHFEELLSLEGKHV